MGFLQTIIQKSMAISIISKNSKSSNQSNNRCLDSRLIFSNDLKISK